MKKDKILVTWSASKLFEACKRASLSKEDILLLPVNFYFEFFFSIRETDVLRRKEKRRKERNSSTSENLPLSLLYEEPQREQVYTFHNT